MFTEYYIESCSITNSLIKKFTDTVSVGHCLLFGFVLCSYVHVNLFVLSYSIFRHLNRLLDKLLIRFYLEKAIPIGYTGCLVIRPTQFFGDLGIIYKFPKTCVRKG